MTKPNRSAKAKPTTLRQNVPTTKRVGKIWVIAVDPYSRLDFAPMRDWILALAQKTGARVEAAYVLAPASLNWTGEFSGPWIKRYAPLAEKKLKEYVGSDQIRSTVVPCREAGQRAAVDAVLNFAKKRKATSLLISTHARRGVERMALGSFAETLVLAATIAVWVVNPSLLNAAAVGKILVPVDLSKKTDQFVLNVADLAKRLNAEVVLFHKQFDPLDPIIQQGVYSLGGGWVSVQNYVDEDMAEKNKHLQKLEAMVRKLGVPVSHVVDSSPAGLMESVDQAVKDTDSDMIAVLTQSGKWSAKFLGSVARSLIRSARRPVLIEH